jgi:hypothetical protein
MGKWRKEEEVKEDEKGKEEMRVMIFGMKKCLENKEGGEERVEDKLREMVKI